MNKKKQSSTYSQHTRNEWTYLLIISRQRFIGKKPSAVCFGDERVAVKNWREVFRLLLTRCNKERHDELMYLRDRVFGRIHTYLSESPNGMKRPIKIDEGLFADGGQYGTETLLYILCDLILKPAHYDYSGVRIALRSN